MIIEDHWGVSDLYVGTLFPKDHHGFREGEEVHHLVSGFGNASNALALRSPLQRRDPLVLAAVRMDRRRFTARLSSNDTRQE